MLDREMRVARTEDSTLLFTSSRRTGVASPQKKAAQRIRGRRRGRKERPRAIQKSPGRKRKCLTFLAKECAPAAPKALAS